MISIAKNDETLVGPLAQKENTPIPIMYHVPIIPLNSRTEDSATALSAVMCLPRAIRSRQRKMLAVGRGRADRR